MPLTIDNKTIEQIWIIDDDSAVRKAYSYLVNVLETEPVSQNGPINDISAFLASASKDNTAVICDYHLKQKNYACDNGDLLVAECYRRGIPAVLSTRYSLHISDHWKLRREIPVLVSPTDLDPDVIANGLELCMKEFAGVFQPVRKPVRTLIRIEGIDTIEDKPSSVNIVIPAWNPHRVLQLSYHTLPPDLLGQAQAGLRFHATVNIGAEDEDELFLCDWEIQ